MINPACWWHEWNADSRFLFLSSLAASCRAEERFGNSNKKKERKERKYEAKPNNNNNEKCVFIWIKYRCGSSINMGWLLSYLNRVFSTLKHTQFLMHSFVLCVCVYVYLVWCFFSLSLFFVSLSLFLLPNSLQFIQSVSLWFIIIVMIIFLFIHRSIGWLDSLWIYLILYFVIRITIISLC